MQQTTFRKNNCQFVQFQQIRFGYKHMVNIKSNKIQSYQILLISYRFHWPEHQHENNVSTCRPTQRSPVTRRKSDWSLQHFMNLQHANCKHQGGCLSHAVDGTIKFLAIGAALSLAQGILPRLRSLYAAKSQVQSNMPPVLRWTLPAFFSTYVSLFRVRT